MEEPEGVKRTFQPWRGRREQGPKPAFRVKRPDLLRLQNIKYPHSLTAPKWGIGYSQEVRNILRMLKGKRPPTRKKLNIQCAFP